MVKPGSRDRIVSSDAFQKQFRADAQRFVDRSGESWRLSFERSARALRPSESKFAGDPYPGALVDWPDCPSCEVPLNFVLQLHQRRFHQMWFPRGKNLFQVFRCPNPRCELGDLCADRYTLSLFARTESGCRRKLVYPDIDIEEHLVDEPDFPNHVGGRIRSRRVRDYPTGYEDSQAWWGKSWIRFRDLYGGHGDCDWSVVEQHYPNASGTKIGGFASWQQGGFPIECDCGRKKKFVFQLASGWIDIIGDDGNLYFFVCKRCGEDSLVTTWDCG